MNQSAFTRGLLALFVGVSLAACSGPAKPSRAQKGMMDTPEYHQIQGDKQLMQGSFEGAKRSYNLALGLDAAHSRSQSGLSVALAYLASGNITEPAKQEVFERGFNLLDSALDNANSDAEKARVHSNGVRFFVVLQRPKDDWYEKAKDHFEDAVQLTPNNPEPYYFMASAEAGKYNYDVAVGLYKKVLSFGGNYQVEADAQLAQIQKIQRALPGSRFGQQIANLPAITRADTAALLVAELRLDRIFMNQSQGQSSSFRAPTGQSRMVTSTVKQMPAATDLTGHPLKDTVDLVVTLGLKGLEPDAAHKFHPSSELSRAEFAMIIQSILAKITGDDSIESQFVGEPSPFGDVKPSRWYYNAVRTVVSRGLMQPSSSGRFDPMGKVSGADALLAVRNLKNLTEGTRF